MFLCDSVDSAVAACTQGIEGQASWCKSHLVPLEHFPDMSKLQWQTLVPQDPPPRLYPPPYPQSLGFSDIALQQAMQRPSVYTEEQPCTSQQFSDDAGDRYASSTGYSHSPPRSPRVKRPSSRNAGTCEYTSAGHFRDRFTDGGVSGQATDDEDCKPTFVDQTQSPLMLFDSPSIDTPDHRRDSCARNMFAKEDLRERAASNVYGLRRLRANPRWAEESADMSDVSLSEGAQILCIVGLINTEWLQAQLLLYLRGTNSMCNQANLSQLYCCA